MIFPLKGADGLYRPFLTRIEPLRENGVVVGWFGTNTDVTEQERDRERLQLIDPRAQPSRQKYACDGSLDRFAFPARPEAEFGETV